MFKRLKTSTISLILVLLLTIPALSSTRALQFEILLNGILHPTTGSPLSAGVVTFFAAGTTTAKNAWTAKDKTGAITSATLGTDGRYQAYGDGEYKLVIKDSGGTTRYTIDNMRVQYPNYAIISKSATYEVTPDDDFVLVDTTGGNVTITFETAANFTHPITVKNIGTNDVVLDPDGSETIDGDSTYTLSSQYESTTLVSDSSNWSKTIDFPAATTSTAGKVELSTNSEAIALFSETSKAIVPSNLPQLLYSVFQRAQFVYNDADQIDAQAASYFVKDKLAQWTATITTVATGAAGGAEWWYLYLDYSAITSGDPITSSELIWSTSAPTFSATYRQWIISGGDDRCIFAVRVDGSNNILEFFHYGDFVTWADGIQEASTVDYDTTFLDVDMKTSMPVFSVKALIRVRTFFDTTAAVSSWRTNGQTGSTGKFINEASADTESPASTLPIITDSAQIFEIKHSASNASTSSVENQGWYFPEGM